MFCSKEDLEKKEREKRELEKTLKNCRLCKNKYGLAPFFFPMNNQKVMLITACPSFQAIYKPLTSIRFFRVLCLALFGEQGISERAIEQFQPDGNIYWTHYHKCYYENFFIDRRCKNLPNTCYKQYINYEIDLLEPELVVVLGKATVQKIQKYTIKEDEVYLFKKDGYQYIASDFPVTGNEKRFGKIREYLKQHITFTGIKPHNVSIHKTVNTKKSKHSVHLDFELEAIKRYAGDIGALSMPAKNACVSGKTSDELWYAKIIVPNLKRYSVVTSSYFFIENQIKTFLFDVFSGQNAEKNNDKESIWYIIDKFKKRREMGSLKGRIRPINLQEVVEIIENDWIKLLKEYLRFMVKGKMDSYLSSKNSLIEEYERLENKIINLKKIRNLIVHQNGFISQAGIKQCSRINFSNYIEDYKPLVSEFDGIKIFVNMVYVTEKGCEEVITLANELVAFIKKIEKPVV